MVKFVIFRNFLSNILLKIGKIQADPLVFYVANFFPHRRIFRFAIAFCLIPRNILNKLQVFAFDMCSASLLRDILISYIFIYMKYTSIYYIFNAARISAWDTEKRYFPYIKNNARSVSTVIWNTEKCSERRWRKSYGFLGKKIPIKTIKYGTYL